MKNKKAILGIFAALIVVAVVALGANSELFQGRSIAPPAKKDSPPGTSILKELAGAPTDAILYIAGEFVGQPYYSSLTTFKQAIKLGKLPKGKKYNVGLRDNINEIIVQCGSSLYITEQGDIKCDAESGDESVSVLIFGNGGLVLQKTKLGQGSIGKYNRFDNVIVYHY